MEATTRDTITEQHLREDALRELVLLGLKAKRPTDSIIGVLAIKPSKHGGFDLTVQRASQDVDFIRAILDVEAEYAARALNQLTKAGNFWLGFSKAQMAREYRLAVAGMKSDLTPDSVVDALRQLDLRQLKDCACAWAAGTPWTGV